jgi:hypothetical protein
MFTHFIINCIIEVEQTIDTPPTGFFTKTNTAIRLSYRIGSTIKDRKLIKIKKNIDVDMPGRAAAFLHRHGVLRAYVGEEVRLYAPKIFTMEDNNVPIQREVMVPITWADVDLSRKQVHTIAAREEFVATANVMGLHVADYIFVRAEEPGKVVEFPRIYRAA